MADYMAECDKAVDEVADGRTEVPFEEVAEATANVPAPEVEAVPRRRRRRTELNTEGWINLADALKDEL
jgi:hypothetical protein